ncbi:hypothetical protein I4U23_023242 [Adineta vaga]|nr:hypothetical protein I4U23_023242 [Adineta vaga]
MAFIVGGWCFTFGSFFLLLADLQQWWHDRKGCCSTKTDRDDYELPEKNRSSYSQSLEVRRLKKAENGIHSFITACGSACYVVGSALLIPFFEKYAIIEGMTISDLKFPNINSLSITLPINDHLLSFVQKLDRLNLLKVSRPNDMPNTTAHAQLQTVLDHIPNLSTLKFSSWPHTTLERCQPFINSSIRQLNFLGYNHWFSEEDCIELSRSSLAIRCEILYIKVRKQTDILYLINTMRNLRAVVVRLFGDDSISYLSQKEHQFDYWLQHNLPSGCSIKRDSRYVHHIRIWIDF